MAWPLVVFFFFLCAAVPQVLFHFLSCLWCCCPACASSPDMELSKVQLLPPEMYRAFSGFLIWFMCTSFFVMTCVGSLLRVLWPSLLKERERECVCVCVCVCVCARARV